MVIECRASNGVAQAAGKSKLMFSICRSDQTRRGLACLAVILLAIAACSRDQNSSGDPQSAAPLVELQSPAPGARTADVLVSEITAGGIRATYRATFADDQLRRIGETRAVNASDQTESVYEFQGARLLSYLGAQLNGAGSIEIRFNLQGAVTMSRAAGGEVTPQEIAAIRTRAQLLRSHALAQRATRAHQTR
jgi:DNA-binding transcriptional regulator YdaS (Cro superfamily)